jgi:putative FmdB family regulatory protein
MPLYDFKCLSCHKVFEGFKKLADEMPLCRCGGAAEIILNTKGRDWFQPHWNENLDHKPVFVESKKQYREECKKRGLTAKCLL